MSGGTPTPATDPTPDPRLAPAQRPDPLAAAATEPTVGHKIGSYRLVRLIGAGATGRVFEVEHLTIGRRAAMKILAPEHAARPGAIRRLFSEAQAINKISHPHIVEVTDLVEVDEASGANAIVMELLEGKSLAQAIADDRRMSPARFLPILAQVADALAAAHAARFVHRDLKPENIYLCAHHGRADYVKLLDFGLVKTVTESRDLEGELTPDGRSAPTDDARPPMTRLRATAEGTFVGTPAYASPEQAAGKPVDHRTDIYALGVILYELLCGRLPFDGRNFGEFVVKHLTEEPPPTPPDVLRSSMGRSLDGIARRCLSKDPNQRFDSVAELRDLFQRLSAGALPLAALRAAGRARWLLVGGAVVALLLAVLALRSQERPALSPAAEAPARASTPRVVPLLPRRAVVLTFTSQPPGAETRVVGEDQLLGQTPFTRTEEANGAEMHYEMRLPGFAPRRDKVVLSEEPATRLVGGPLKKLAPEAPPRPRARAFHAPGAGPKKSSRNSTLNPFAR